jgi:SNF2 family DNA or RNA helicase
MSARGTLEYERASAGWLIRCTPDIAMRLKRIFPRMSQSRGTELRLKHTAEVANDLEWIRQRFRLEMAEDDEQLLSAEAERYRERQARTEAILTAPPRTDSFAMTYPPREYQATAARLYLEQGHLLLADVVGLGKTISAIASLTDPRTLPAVVVVKAHLPKQWVNELARFMPLLCPHVIKKRENYTLPDADVFICTYSKLDAWWGILAQRCKSVVYDEIQELRIDGSSKYRAAKSLSYLIPFRLGLSATPIHNYGGEAWNIFNLLCPDALGTFEEFFREWCTGYRDKPIVAEPEALGSFLRNNKLMLRRTRKDVGRELPPITRFVQDVEFDAKVYEKSTSAADELARTILTGTFLERGQAARQFDLEIRQATGLAKAPFVAELVRMLIESGESVLLGGWHRAVYEVWKDRLADLNPVFFTGHESANQKEEARQAFITGKTKLLIMSLRSGAGTNGLQDVCSVAVLGELDWTPAVHDQFIGRLARDGQDEPVQVFIPVAPVGSDPTMATVLGLKEEQAAGIVDLGEDVDIDQVDVDPQRLRKLAEDYLKARKIALPEQQLEGVA